MTLSLLAAACALAADSVSQRTRRDGSRNGRERSRPALVVAALQPIALALLFVVDLPSAH